LLDDLIDLPHLGAVADHRAERAVLAELAAQRFDFAQGFLALDNLVQKDLQALDVDWLGEVVVGALFHRLDRGLDGSLGGEQQRRDVGALCLKSTQETQTVHTRHDEVGNDDRWPEGRHFLERIFTIRSRIGHKSPALDQLLEAHTSRGVVFDNQHPFRERRSLGRI
jgi:hypothetical protein